MTIPTSAAYSAGSLNGRARLRPRRTPRLLTAYLLFVLGYALLFAFWQIEPLPGQIHALGVLIFATSLAPMMVWAARRQRGLPMFELIALSYALQYSMPLYTQARGLIIFSQYVPVSWQALYQALWLVEGGLVAFIAGYYLFRRSPLAALAPRLDLPFAGDRRTVYLLLSFVGGGMVLALSAAGFTLFQAAALAAVVRLAASQFTIALIVLGYHIYGQQRPPISQSFVLYAALTFAFLIGLSTGSLENAFVPLVSLFVVRWHAGGKVPWRWLAAAAALFIVLNPAKFTFRDLVWFGSDDYSLGERLSLWSDLAADSTENLLRPTFADDREDVVRSTLSRFDLIHRFAYVHTVTPQIVPYYQGETYAYFLVAWIPRLFWPDKPTATGGANDRMDVDYQFKVEGQPVSVGVGLLPEAFANFGIAGVILVMALQGVVFGLINALLNSDSSEGGRAIYLAIGVYFLNGIGTSASVMFGAIFQQIVASALILRLFASGWRAAPGAAPAKAQPLSGPAITPGAK